MNVLDSRNEDIVSESLNETEAEDGAQDELFEGTEGPHLFENAGDLSITSDRAQQQVGPKKLVSVERQKLIERLEAVRLEDAAMLRRRNNAVDMLAEIYDHLGYSESDVPFREGTKEELELQYKKLLTIFHNKKEFWVNKTQILKDKMNRKTEEFNNKTKELEELKKSLYELQLKYGMKMFDKTTREKLTREDVLKILDTCEAKNKKIRERRLKFIRKDNKCRQLKKEIEKIKGNTPFNIDKHEHLLQENKMLEESLENNKIILSDDREKIKSMQKKILEIDKEIIELGKIKKEKDAILNELKQQKKEIINIKSHNHKVRTQQRKTHFVDPYEANPLLLKNYEELVVKAEENQKLLANLKPLLEESRETLKELRAREAKLKVKKGKSIEDKYKWK